MQAGPGSLIVNGSFEDGPPVRTFLNIAAGASSLKGWQVTGEGIDIVSDVYWQASHGVRSVDLDGSARSRTSPPYSHGGVAQTFSTTSGTRYLVTFDMAGNTALSSGHEADARLGRRSVDGVCVRYHGQELSQYGMAPQELDVHSQGCHDNARIPQPHRLSTDRLWTGRSTTSR